MARIYLRLPIAAFYAVTAIFVLLTIERSALSQLPTATILGVVKDSSGAIVPDVALTARNVNTGLSRTTTTAGDGSYRFSALPVGSYELRAEHSGFQTTVRGGLTLAVSEEAVVNFTLQVGAVEQTVAVTAEAPLVNTTSGSLGGLVDEQKVADLPLNGRNYMDLTMLQTGITQHKNMTVSASTAGLWFSSNGAPLRSNNFLLDGSIITNFSGSTSASTDGSTLGIGGIREYRVITNSFSAEYGMTMGSQVVMVSKNGTNQFHGDVFEYLRNSALDARNFFDYKSVASRRRLPAYERNQFGASGGGRIKKDKTFFYVAYEGLRESLGITTISNLPAASCHGVGGTTITNTACPQLGVTPSVTIAPTIAPLLALFPNPNLPNNQFTYPYTQPTREDYGMIRVDQMFSANDNFFARYTISDAEQINPTPYPVFVIDRVSRNQYGTLSENHIFSPNLLNTIRFSYSRTNTAFGTPPAFIGPEYSFVPGLPMGSISITGVSGLSPNVPVQQAQNIFSWSDDLNYTHGRHALKFGTLLNQYQQYMLVNTSLYGSVNFANVANFLLGQATTISANSPGSILNRTYHYKTLGFYGQDDIRVFPKLTLNIGLRYEFLTTPQEVEGHGAALRDVQHDASGTLGPVFENMSLRNFSPRFGFAWDVLGNGSTALRGGFAELYDIGILGPVFIVGTTGTPPFSSTSSVSNPGSFSLPFVFPPSAVGKSLRTIDYHMQQPHLLSYNLTVERQLPGKMVLNLAYAGSRGINIVQTVEGNPTIPQVLPGGQLFFPVNPPRTNPNWSSMEFKTAGGNSFYNSLQFVVSKQLSHGLQFQSSYTWGKIIDETQGQLGAEDNSSSIFGVFSTRRTIDRAPANFDITHVWHFNAIYRMPQPFSPEGALAKVWNGWQASGIVSLETGYDYTPTVGSNISRSGTNNGGAGIDRPNLLPGRNNGNIILGGPVRYFDPAAFVLQSPGFLGTAGRNILRGPGLANLDFSLIKDTPIKQLGESGKLEFRAEIFNILNRANFGMPSSSIFSGTQGSTPLSTAGVITSTATKSRQIQLALRLLF